MPKKHLEREITNKNYDDHENNLLSRQLINMKII
jgi:hypothetical protein